MCPSNIVPPNIQEVDVQLLYSYGYANEHNTRDLRESKFVLDKACQVIFMLIFSVSYPTEYD